MNELRIFENLECEELQQIEQSINTPYLGVVYGVEYGDMLKIGHTAKPYTRMKQLRKQAEYGHMTLGRVCISIPHTNHGNTEAAIHAYFSYVRRRGTELFNITIEEFSTVIKSGVFEFLDESERLETQGTAFVDFAKDIALGNINFGNHKDNFTEPCPEFLTISLDLLADILENVQKIMQNQGNTSQDIARVVLAIMRTCGIPVVKLKSEK